MDFHDFPRILGKSECISHPTPQDVCRPRRVCRSDTSSLPRRRYAALAAELEMGHRSRALGCPEYAKPTDEPPAVPRVPPWRARGRSQVQGSGAFNDVHPY